MSYQWSDYEKLGRANFIGLQLENEEVGWFVY